MERKDQKYLDVLKAVDEYNRTVLQRVEQFYFEISENYPKFEPYADKEAARLFPRAYALEMEDLNFLGDVLSGMGGSVEVIGLNPDKVTIKITSRHDDEICMDFDSIFASGSNEEFEEYLNDFLREFQAYGEYFKENELNDEQRKEFAQYLELKQKYEKFA